MQEDKTISGFSRLSKEEKLDWVARHFSTDPEEARQELRRFWLTDAELQQTFDGFSENTVSNFVLPYGVAPNFVIDGRAYAVPMVIEESSVVAAAAAAAKFWMDRGGFRTQVIDTVKLGQVHFRWSGRPERREELFPALYGRLLQEAEVFTTNMAKRGGGVRAVEWLHLPELAPDYYQLRVSFETCDSMGANFINTVLEQFASTLEHWSLDAPELTTEERSLQIIMAILSNYTPDCLVRAEVSCRLDELDGVCGRQMSGTEFAERFALAVRIAREDPYRAVTHNKGIFNGVDAVVLATGNDFRAIEACGHAYAARDGRYRGLSDCDLNGDRFRFWLELPLAVGAVGGLTRLHPLARHSLDILGQPSARQLMSIMAATGLAQNFSAVRSLITTGIQQGHMKMHLQNILTHLGANAAESEQVRAYFAGRVISFHAVREYLEWCRREGL